MNTRILIILLALVCAAGVMLLLALSGGTRELTVDDVLDGRWPPPGTEPAVLARTEVAVTGYCSFVDQPVGPRLVRIVAQPPGEAAAGGAGFNQPALDIEIAPGAKLPDEIRVRAWTRAHGTWNPDTRRFTATRVQMKCPSAEQAKLAPATTP